MVLTLCGWGSLSATARGAAAGAAPGTISTAAGDGTSVTAGNGGPATSAGMQEPYGVAADADGDTLIADTESSEVRLVAGSNCSSDCAFGLGAMTKGDIYALAGTGTPGYSGDGGSARDAKIAYPVGVAVDPQGDLLIADNGNGLIRLVARANCANACPYGLQSMIRGDIYTIAGDRSSSTPGNGVLATNAELSAPEQLAVDRAGNLLITDLGNHRLVLLADEHCLAACPYGLPSMSDGFLYTLAGNGTSGARGDGGPATAAELDEPTGVAVDGEGDLLIGDVASDTVRLVAETSCAFDCQYGLRSMAPGDIYTVAGNGKRGFTGDDKPATITDLDGPIALAVDGDGDLLIADTDNSRIRIVPDIACSSACPYGLPSLYKGFMFTAAGSELIGGFSGDGGPATSAAINTPRAIATDAHGNLLIADGLNFRIRSVVASDPPPVCYETGAREVGRDGFTGSRDQEDVIVYAPGGLASISGVTVRNATESHPAFTPGTVGPVIVTATKTVESMPVSGYYKATDDQGRTTYCGFYLAAG